MQKFHVKHALALFLMAMLCVASLPAHAQKIYRCTGAGGGITISDTPCSSGQGGEMSVKPSAGAAASPAPKPELQTRGAMDKRNAEYNALLTPECRRAREAFMAKSQQKGGMDELMKEGNPISKAWEACELDAKGSIETLNAKDREKADADERKRREQGKVAQQKSECATKQKLLDERRPRLSQMSEQDRAAFRVVEQDVAVRCR